MGRPKKKVPYGVFNEDTKVKYAIVLMLSQRRTRYVTSVSYSPKTFKYDADCKAMFWEDRQTAEYLATSMNVNGYAAFVMAVPDVFNYDDFTNPPNVIKKDKGKEDGNG